MNFFTGSLTNIIIAINVLFYFLSKSNRQLYEQSVMKPYDVLKQQQYYRFISSGFMHANLPHLFFNMFTLYFFGNNLELILKYYNLGGSTAYLALYFCALIASDIPSFLKYRNSPHYASLGASGAVSAIVFATIVFNPWSSIYLYDAIKISAMLYAVLFVVYSVYMGKRGQDNINHDAHLWGALFGLGFVLILILILEPILFQNILESLKHPSLFGRD